MAQPRNEELALTNLARQGFEAFLPRRWVTRRRARGFRVSLEPVFPRYLFVSLDLDVHRWRSINGTYGVSRLVAFGDRPTPIASEVAETLRASTGQDGALVFSDPLHPGDRVRLIRGPFANELGVLEALDSQGRVRLLLELLGRQVRASAWCTDIEPCAAAARQGSASSLCSGAATASDRIAGDERRGAA
jgi:transcriptional antiterminator RfaH